MAPGFIGSEDQNFVNALRGHYFVERNVSESTKQGTNGTKGIQSRINVPLRWKVPTPDSK